jgi:hypothetical protein
MFTNSIRDFSSKPKGYVVFGHILTCMWCYVLICCLIDLCSMTPRKTAVAPDQEGRDVEMASVGLGNNQSVSAETDEDIQTRSAAEFEKLFDLSNPHPSIDMRRMEVIKEKLQALDDDEEKKRKIIIMKYATDPFFFDDDSPDEVWEAFQRLEAWEDNTAKMVFTTVLQCLLTGFCLVGTNEPITIGTAVTTICYIIGLFVFNPTKNTDRVVAQIHELLESVSGSCGGYGWYIACFICWPFMVVGVVMGLCCDIALEDDVSSWYQFWDIFTGIFVRLTALSVGLRSYNPLYALGAFIGFEFIGEFDEQVMTLIEVDMTKAFVIHEYTSEQVVRKLFHLQMATYISLIFFYFLVIYYTVNNTCFLFCYDDGSPLNKLTGISGI